MWRQFWGYRKDGKDDGLVIKECMVFLGKRKKKKPSSKDRAGREENGK